MWKHEDAGEEEADTEDFCLLKLPVREEAAETELAQQAMTDRGLGVACCLEVSSESLLLSSLEPFRGFRSEKEVMYSILGLSSRLLPGDLDLERRLQQRLPSIATPGTKH